MLIVIPYSFVHYPLSREWVRWEGVYLLGCRIALNVKAPLFWGVVLWSLMKQLRPVERPKQDHPFSLVVHASHWISECSGIVKLALGIIVNEFEVQCQWTLALLFLYRVAYWVIHAPFYKVRHSIKRFSSCTPMLLRENDFVGGPASIWIPWKLNRYWMIDPSWVLVINRIARWLGPSACGGWWSKAKKSQRQVVMVVWCYKWHILLCTDFQSWFIHELTVREQLRLSG